MTIEEIYAKGMEFAAQFRLTLNWQSTDAERIEQVIMPAMEEALKAGELNDIAVQNIAAMLGVYLGELMLRDFAAEQGWKWARESADGLPYLTDGARSINPMAKVYKRVTQGSADSVSSFYNVCRAIVTGKLTI